MASKKRPLDQISVSATESANGLCGLCQEPLHCPPSGINANIDNIASTSNGNMTSDGPDPQEQSRPKGVPRQISLPDETNDHMNGGTSNALNESGEEGNIISGDSDRERESNGTSTTNGNLSNSNELHTIVTCANMCGEAKFCKAAAMNNESPHFHFSCLEKVIPQGSKLFWDLCQYLDYREEEKKKRKIRKLAKENAKDLGAISINGKNINLPDKIPLDRRGCRSVSNSPLTIGHFQHTPSSSGRSTPSVFLNSNSRKVTKNPFLCPICDIRGSSAFLEEYFTNFRAAKTKFFEDDEAIDSIMPVGKYKETNEENKKSDSSASYIGVSKNGRESGAIAKENGFVQHLMSRQENYDEDAAYRPTELTMDRIQYIMKYTARYQANGGANDVFDFDSINASYLIGQPIRLFCDVSNTYHTGRIIDMRDVKDIDTNRLKKATKAKYAKRWKAHESKGDANDSNSNQNQKIYLDEFIGRTQYLVRFRSRMEGRKVALQKWMYLEEHPVAVGINIVWVNVYREESQMDTTTGISVSDTKGALRNFSDGAKTETKQQRKRRLKRLKSRFRPGHIFLRSALEMMHVDALKDAVNSNDIASLAPMRKESMNAVAYLFGEEFRCISVNITDSQNNGLKIAMTHKSTILSPTKSRTVRPGDQNIPSEPSAAMKTGAVESPDMDLALLESSFEHLLVADFHSPPEELCRYLKVLRAYDESLVDALTIACLEEEEQQRILEDS